MVSAFASYPSDPQLPSCRVSANFLRKISLECRRGRGASWILVPKAIGLLLST
jgi:hypothetical protein